MSPEEFKKVRYRLGMSQNDFADMIGLGSDRTVRRWEEGVKDIPGPVELLLELIVKIPEVREYLELELSN